MGGREERSAKISADENDNPHVYLKQGDVYRKTGYAAKAIASYHRSARLLRRQGFNQKAVALYKIILHMDPKDEDAIFQSGKAIQYIESDRRPTQKNSPVDGLSAVVPGT